MSTFNPTLLLNHRWLANWRDVQSLNKTGARLVIIVLVVAVLLLTSFDDQQSVHRSKRQSTPDDVVELRITHLKKIKIVNKVDPNFKKRTRYFIYSNKKGWQRFEEGIKTPPDEKDVKLLEDNILHKPNKGDRATITEMQEEAKLPKQELRQKPYTTIKTRTLIPNKEKSPTMRISMTFEFKNKKWMNKKSGREAYQQQLDLINSACGHPVDGEVARVVNDMTLTPDVKVASMTLSVVRETSEILTDKEAERIKKEQKIE